MKSAIAQLQPIVNKYLTEKPLFLPDHVAPLAASPVLHLWSIGKTQYSKHLYYVRKFNFKRNLQILIIEFSGHKYYFCPKDSIFMKP